MHRISTDYKMIQRLSIYSTKKMAAKIVLVRIGVDNDSLNVVRSLKNVTFLDVWLVNSVTGHAI